MKEPNKMTFSYFCFLLEQEEVNYNINGSFFMSKNQGLTDNVILIVESVDTKVCFEDIEENASSIYEYKIVVIGTTQFKPKYKVYPL